jgi:protein involved in polysaccharide export with SLBB domain
MRNCAGGNLDVSLTAPKKAEVILVGDSLNSGSYRLDGALRILDAIKMAAKSPPNRRPGKGKGRRQRRISRPRRSSGENPGISR